MSFAQRRLIGWAVLLVFAAAGAAWLLQLDYARKISTDVLDLIPVGDQEPEIAVVRELATQAEARTMLFSLTKTDGTAAPVEAARMFATALARSRVFAQAIACSDPEWRDRLGKELFERRFELLFPAWLEAHKNVQDLPAAVAEELKTFLQTPEALAFQDLVPADPLLLLPGALAQMKNGLSLAQMGGMTGERSASGLVWAQLAVSPLREEGQGPAFAAIDAALSTARANDAGLQVAFTGVNRFAAASRARIEREVSWLNLLSLTAVLVVAWVFIRGVHRALHLLPAIGFAMLGAWVATTMAFEKVHVIVFVLGALLTGVAIDYGFYLYMQPPARPDEDYWEKVRRLTKPLLASCLTTVVGFALLLFSELPMIRQLGVFVGAGLLCALGAAIVYFSTVKNPFLEARAFRGRAELPANIRLRLRRVLMIAGVIMLPGLAMLSWRDDVRELEVPEPVIKQDDVRIRALFGERGERSVFLTRGNTLAAARDALLKFEAWLRASGGSRVTFSNLGPLVPTTTAYREAKMFSVNNPDFPQRVQAALHAGGFDESAFAPFFTAYAEQSKKWQTVEAKSTDELPVPRLPGPPSLLLHLGRNGQVWFVTIASNAPKIDPPPDTRTVSTSQLQSLNRLFTNYRASALRLSLAGLGLVGLGVFLTYGIRDGVRIFAIPCGACLGIFGLFGWLGHPLNLFHLLGAFLGVCLTHNYSIFSATSAYRHEPTPVSVRLSALTTAASFGVLAFSGIPVVRALGVTVASMVIAALAVIELEHLAPLAKKK
jgi:predicted exporter